MAREMQEQLESILGADGFSSDIGNSLKAGIEDASKKTSDLIGALQNLFEDANPKKVEKLEKLTALLNKRPDPTTDETEFNQFKDAGDFKEYEKGKAARVAAAQPAKEQTAAPEGAKSEAENVSAAREKFQASVKKFITEANKNGPFDAHIEGLLKDIEDFGEGALPKRPDSKIVDTMVIVQKKIEEKQRLDKKTEAEIAATAAAINPIIKETREAHAEYKEAVVAEKKQEMDATPPSFVDRADETGKEHKLLVAGGGVQATNNSIQSFRAALTEFKGPKSESAPNGERAYTNVKLIAPPVDMEKLESNVRYRNNVHERVIETLKSGLMPASEVAMLTQAYSGPSKTARQWRLFTGAVPRALGLNALDFTDKIPPLFDRPDANLRAKQAQELQDAVGDYKKNAALDKAGRAAHKSQTYGESVVEKQNQAALTVKQATPPAAKPKAEEPKSPRGGPG